MAQIDDTISTYLTAIEVEGKTQNTVLSYRASLEDFRRVARPPRPSPASSRPTPSSTSTVSSAT